MAINNVKNRKIFSKVVDLKCNENYKEKTLNLPNFSKEKFIKNLKKFTKIFEEELHENISNFCQTQVNEQIKEIDPDDQRKCIFEKLCFFENSEIYQHEGILNPLSTSINLSDIQKSYGLLNNSNNAEIITNIANKKIEDKIAQENFFQNQALNSSKLNLIPDNQKDNFSITKVSKCKCTKSKCLKMYCECFMKKIPCNGCECRDCHNNHDHEPHIDYNLAMSNDSQNEKQSVQQNIRFCVCVKSNCLKKYCECYNAGILCSDECRCSGCKNCKSPFDRKHYFLKDLFLHKGYVDHLQYQMENFSVFIVERRINYYEISSNHYHNDEYMEEIIQSIPQKVVNCQDEECCGSIIEHNDNESEFSLKNTKKSKKKNQELVEVNEQFQEKRVLRSSRRRNINYQEIDTPIFGNKKKTKPKVFQNENMKIDFIQGLIIINKNIMKEIKKKTRVKKVRKRIKININRKKIKNDDKLFNFPQDSIVSQLFSNVKKLQEFRNFKNSIFELNKS